MGKNKFKLFLDNEFKLRKKDLYQYMRWSKTTYVERRNNPNSLKLGEIIKLALFLELSPSDLIKKIT